MDINNDAPLEGVSSFAVSGHHLSKKAKKQPRDSNGRWVASGANVQWSSNGTRWAGTVKSIRDGKAMVEVRHPDGRKTMTTLMPETLRVQTSKARLSAKDKHTTEVGNVKAKLADPMVQDELEKTGSAVIQDANGYTLEASKDKKDENNPYIYQLFSPTGKSLGKYSDPTAPFDGMIEGSVSGAPGDGFPDGEEDTDVEAPVESEAPAESAPVASEFVVRVARDGSEAIVASGSEFRTVSLEYGHVVEASAELSSLIASGSWRKALKSETIDSLSKNKPVLLLEDVIVASAMQKTYRVPKRVIAEIYDAAEVFTGRDALIASVFTDDGAVGAEEVYWLNKYFKNSDDVVGNHSVAWSNKIIAPLEEEEAARKYNLDDTLSYFGTGHNEYEPTVESLIAVDFVHGHVYVWGESGFELTEDLIVDSIDAPLVLPLDVDSARAVAFWKDSGSSESVDVREFDWEERNVFDAAESEIDYEEIDDLSNIVASVEQYTPQERSRNAKRQRRGPGGKFGQGAVAPSSKKLGGTYAKARLNVALPIVENPWDKISAWAEGLADPLTQEEKKRKEQKQAIQASGEEVTAEAETTESASESLYFAIVDNVDRTAVLDVVAITKENGAPQVWKRSNGDWVADNDISVALQGAAPPPIVKLESPDPATDVIAQVDSYDTDGAVTAGGYAAEDCENAAKKGYALPDGSFPINDVEDLKNAIQASGLMKDSYMPEVKRHIKKRAQALNRMDVVPENWRAMSSDEVNSFMNHSPLYGDFGEVIVASGVPGIADTPSDWAAVKKLERYWTVGRGAAKIRWGTPGDLTRAHRHLAKYVGPNRAWGLAQKLHRQVFGVYNATRDKV